MCEMVIFVELMHYLCCRQNQSPKIKELLYTGSGERNRSVKNNIAGATILLCIHCCCIFNSHSFLWRATCKRIIHSLCAYILRIIHCTFPNYFQSIHTQERIQNFSQATFESLSALSAKAFNPRL